MGRGSMVITSGSSLLNFHLFPSCLQASSSWVFLLGRSHFLFLRFPSRFFLITRSSQLIGSKFCYKGAPCPSPLRTSCILNHRDQLLSATAVNVGPANDLLPSTSYQNHRFLNVYKKRTLNRSKSICLYQLPLPTNKTPLGLQRTPSEQPAVHYTAVSVISYTWDEYSSAPADSGSSHVPHSNQRTRQRRC